MREPEEIIKAQLKYYNEHNLNKFCKQFHDYIEVYDLLSEKLLLKGIDNFRARYRNSFEVLKVNAKLVNRIILGDKIIDHEHVTKAGSKEILEAVAIYLVDGNKVSKVWFLQK